jgi:hypothetical protein
MIANVEVIDREKFDGIKTLRVQEIASIGTKLLWASIQGPRTFQSPAVLISRALEKDIRKVQDVQHTGELQDLSAIWENERALLAANRLLGLLSLIATRTAVTYLGATFSDVDHEQESPKLPSNTEPAATIKPPRLVLNGSIEPTAPPLHSRVRAVANRLMHSKVGTRVDSGRFLNLI